MTAATAPTPSSPASPSPAPTQTAVASPAVNWQDAFGNASLVNVTEANVPFDSFTNYSHAIADDGAFFNAAVATDVRQKALQQKQFLDDGLLNANLSGADVSDFLVAPPAGSTEPPRPLVDIILDDSRGEAAQHSTILALMNKTYYDEKTVFHVDKKVNALVHEILFKVSSEVAAIDTNQVKHDYSNKSQPSCPLSLSDPIKPLVSGETAEVLEKRERETDEEPTGIAAEEFSRAVSTIAAAGIPLIASGSGYEIEKIPAIPPATLDTVKVADTEQAVKGAITAYLPYGMENGSAGNPRGPSVLVEVTEPQGVRRFVVPLATITEVETHGTSSQRSRMAQELLSCECFLNLIHGIGNIIDIQSPLNRRIGSSSI